MRLSIAVVVLALAGCVGADVESGNASPAAAKRAACQTTCNRDYDVCADSAGAQRSGAGSFFGAGAACSRQVAACIQQCKAVVVQPQKKISGEQAPKELP